MATTPSTSTVDFGDFQLIALACAFAEDVGVEVMRNRRRAGQLVSPATTARMVAKATAQR